MSKKEFVEDLISAKYTDTYIPKHQFGPDYIIQTNANRTWERDGVINLNPHDDDDPRFKPESVITFFRKAVENSPNKLALAVKRNDVIQKWTYMQHWHNVRNVAKGFIKLGLNPFNAVAILGSNSPEWMTSYLAAIFCGGFATGIYTTNSPEACQHVLENSSAKIIIVDKKHQLDKILQVRDKLPELKTIVLYDDDSEHPDVISWQDLLRIGQSLPEEILERRIKGIAINQCCTLIYTSGTTGNPKGVMLCHDSLIYEVKMLVYNVTHTPKNGKTVSYLPLSHVAALIMDLFLAIFTETTIHFAHPDALKGKLIEDLTRVQPTYFMGVPRVYEKIKEKIEASEASLSVGKKKLIKWARKQALAYNQRLSESPSKPLLYLAVKKFVLKKIKQAIGIQDVEFFLCGGAPLAVEVVQFFQSIDIVLHDTFGLSESSGGHIMTTPKHLFRMGSVGNVHTLPDMRSKILDPDSDGSGELLAQGRHLFMGYLDMEEETKEAIEEGKWLHTGDVGMIDKDGFLFITGRIKEIIITSGGENIPPVLIETKIKEILPVISNCMLIGDKRKYLTILLTLKTEVDLRTLEPTDKLNPIAIKWCQSVGSLASTVSEILQTTDSNVMREIQNGINEYNEKYAISRAQKIQKWTILPQDFCMHNGTLGPTSKLKRQFVIKKYRNVIKAMYLS